MRFTSIALIATALFLSGCDDKSSPQASAPAPVAKPALTEQQRSDLISTATKDGFEVERDKVEKITFYSPKTNSSEWSNQYLGVYISVPDGKGPIFRIYPHYQGDDWIFFDHLKVLADNEIVYEKEYSSSDMRRDAKSSRVYESTDYAAKDDDIAAMRKISSARSVTVRLSGRDHRQDFEMSQGDRQRIARALSAYDSLQPLSN
ncbi:hypothetical protein [Burkholderia sp. AU45388]|uniref:hypothetical protein n=1 Tax=Burkholderia sp. AU45388 TaxID=3059206 RepID=UPI00264BF3C6|nr:hypothetical protein [Burkholderia sp. AU45388]MDN7427783.1 hypothetical protein [Burkholderia sp. AU45388]